MMAPMSCGSRSGARWFCAWTAPSQEFRAYTELTAQGFEVCLPLHLHRPVGHPERERIVPLFVRYLFIRFDPAETQWRRIYGTRGIAGIISAAPERPTPLPAGAVEGLIARMSARRVVDDPGLAEAAQYFTPGDRVRSRAMPELAGVCKLSDGERVSVLLSMFGRPVTAEFKASELEAA